MRRIVASVDDWDTVIDGLQNELDRYSDPIDLQTEYGSLLIGICGEVENELGVWLEPSIQLGQGGLLVFDANDNVVADCDYEDFNSDVIDLALTADSESEFKKKYKDFLHYLMDEYASENKD
jgi:hypothetical protein